MRARTTTTTTRTKTGNRLTRTSKIRNRPQLPSERSKHSTTAQSWYLPTRALTPSTRRSTSRRHFRRRQTRNTWTLCSRSRTSFTSSASASSHFSFYRWPLTRVKKTTDLYSFGKYMSTKLVRYDTLQRRQDNSCFIYFQKVFDNVGQNVTCVAYWNHVEWN